MSSATKVVKMPKNKKSAGHDISMMRAKNSLSKFLNSHEVITEAGKGSVERICNPCGEHSYTNARFPDGSVTQSGEMQLRKTEFISPPFINQNTVGDTTKNWSLFVISMPCFSGVGLVIACPVSSTPSNSSLQSIFKSINDNGVSTYPTWNTIVLTQSTYYYSYMRYEAANLDIDYDTNESKNIQSFRIVGDGMVFHHNAPSLWDQGGFTVGQFQANAELIEGQTLSVPVSFEVVRQGTTSQFSSLRIFTIINGSRQYILNTAVVTVPSVASTTFAGVGFGAPYSIYRSDGVEWVHDVSPSPSPFPIYAWTTTGDAAVPYINFAVSQTGPVISFAAPLNTTTLYVGGFSRSAVLGANEPVSSHVVTVPPFRMSEVAQADTKWDAELMKDHGGFYVVRRYFQPKLFMTEVSETGSIKFIVPGMEELVVRDGDGGILGDAMDRNGAVISIAMVGLSYAALPFLKANRYIEFLPAPNSPLAPFVGDAPDRDEDAEEIFRHIQVAGPHAYPPDFNSLGFLATAITTLIESIPLALRTTRTLGQAVTQASDWVAEKLKIKL